MGLRGNKFVDKIAKRTKQNKKNPKTNKQKTETHNGKGQGKALIKKKNNEK